MQRYEKYGNINYRLTKYFAGLRAICQRFLPHHMDAFDDAIARSLERTAVVKITLAEPPIGKRKQYDKQGEDLITNCDDIYLPEEKKWLRGNP